MGLSTKDIALAERMKMMGGGGEPHPAEPGYDVPVSNVRLPSLGRVYPPESPLFGCESVDVKAMTAKEENILSSPALVRKGTVLTTLMKACITNRTVDPDQMVVGDRNAVLVAIRVAAYGAKYDVSVTCPKCLEEVEHQFDLSRLPLKVLTEEPEGGPGSNLFSYALPVSGKRARYRLMTAADVSRLEDDMEAARKSARGGVEPTVTLRLRAQVTALEGVAPEGLAKAIDALPARDARMLREHMDAMAPGVDMMQEFECNSCGRSSVVDVPVGTEFFWPTKLG